MSSKIRNLVIVLVALVAAACGVAGDVSGGPPQGSFVLVSGTDLTLVDTHPVTLDVEGDEVGGIAACNRYGGRVAFDGAAIAVSDVSATEMGCMPFEIMELEQAYLTHFVNVESWVLEGETLVLSGSGFELVFEQAIDTP